MKLLLTLPGGSEIAVILLFILFVLLVPILAVVFYSKTIVLKKQVEELTMENIELRSKLVGKNL